MGKGGDGMSRALNEIRRVTPARIYIAGSISNLPDLNRGAFAKAAAQLSAAGYEPINPHELCADIPEGGSHSVFMARCLPAVREAYGVALLEGWMESPGAIMEYNEAFAAGIYCMSVRRWVEDAKLARGEPI